MDDLTLRDYQVKGADFLYRQRRAYLADVPGVGKTAQAITAAQRRIEGQSSGRVLIVAPKHVLTVWQRELRRWAKGKGEGQGGGGLVYVYTGTPDQRRRLQVHIQAAYKRGPIWLITNYAMMDEASRVVGVNGTAWDVLIIDEFHNLRNMKTKQRIKAGLIKSDHLYLLSGSPVIGHPLEFYSAFNLINRRMYNSYWLWVNTYFNSELNNWGGVDIGGIKDKEAFRKRINMHVLRRKLDDIEIDLPDQIHQNIELTMNVDQQKVYDSIIADRGDAYGDIPGGDIFTPNELARIIRLRQTLITPAMFNSIDDSALLDSLVEYLRDDLHAREQVVIFVPWTKAIPLIRKRIVSRIGDSLLEDSDIGVISGGMTPAKLSVVVDQFAKGRLRVCIVSLHTATGYSLTNSRIAYFVGRSWTPEDNDQAIARLHRIGQHRSVFIRTFTYPETIDDGVDRVLSGKIRLRDLVSYAR
jgi:SNF2 family DNA or RNA helicase